MPNREGLGALVSVSAEEVSDCYHRAMADGRIDAHEDRTIRQLHAVNITDSAEIGLTLTVISTVARCGTRSRRARRLTRDWTTTVISTFRREEPDPLEAA